jgi:ribosomal protein S17
MKIEKKVQPPYFEAILKGDKNFEVRLNDFECNEGDILVLREWDPEKKDYTGRTLEKKVTYVVKTRDLPFWSQEEVEKNGYQIIGFKPEE